MMNTTAIPYTITDDTITVFLDGVPKMVAKTPKSEQILNDALATGDLTTLRLALDPASGLSVALDGTGVHVVNGTIVFRGKRIAGHLEDRIFDLIDAGVNIDRWKAFVERIYSNPSITAIDEFALFMENGKLPITEDGCFLAYKRVTDDYLDTHSRTIDNSVGQVVTMARREVDDDRNRTCSVGLHFCSQDYLKSYLRGTGRIMVVKIDPADVVSIPSDYNNTKGRCWRYEVVGEIDVTDEADREAWGVLTNRVVVDDYDGAEGVFDSPTVSLDKYDDDSDFWEDEDDDEYDEEEVISETAFVAPGPERKSFWRRFLKG